MQITTKQNYLGSVALSTLVKETRWAGHWWAYSTTLPSAHGAKEIYTKFINDNVYFTTNSSITTINKKPSCR